MKWPALLAIAGLLAGCSAATESHPAATTSPSSTAPVQVSTGGPSRGLTTRVPPPHPVATIEQSGYRHDETFCAVRSGNGRIGYVVMRHHVTLRLAASDLPHHADLSVGWHNAHSARGYVIASFETDNDGATEQRTLRMFRAGEVRGSELYLLDRTSHVVAQLRPCQ
jgi:hypothetical protein